MRFLKQILIVALTVVGLASCGGYHKLLKSTDSDKKYAEGLRYFYNKDFTKAATLFKDVSSAFQGSLREDTILFYMGKSLYSSGLYEEAAEMMNSFRYKYTRSAFTEESEFVYAMCFFQQSGDYEKDQSTSFKAIQSFNDYLNRYPESIKAEDIYLMIEEMSKKIYRKRFNNAAIYYKLGKYNAAITALRSTLKQYPEIPYKEEIMYLVCKSWFDYAENSIEGRQLDRYLKMMDAYYSYKSEYPDEEKRLKELEPMFNKAKLYADENGYQAKAVSQDKVDIEERLTIIAEKKDKRFFATSKAEREKITSEIKYEQEQLKKDRKAIREGKKESIFQKQQQKNLKKQATAQPESKAATKVKTIQEPTKADTKSVSESKEMTKEKKQRKSSQKAEDSSTKKETKTK